MLSLTGKVDWTGNRPLVWDPNCAGGSGGSPTGVDHCPQLGSEGNEDEGTGYLPQLPGDMYPAHVTPACHRQSEGDMPA